MAGGSNQRHRSLMEGCEEAWLPGTEGTLVTYGRGLSRSHVGIGGLLLRSNIEWIRPLGKNQAVHMFLRREKKMFTYRNNDWTQWKQFTADINRNFK
jgi:hypothetical protein